MVVRGWEDGDPVVGERPNPLANDNRSDEEGQDSTQVPPVLSLTFGFLVKFGTLTYTPSN